MSHMQDLEARLKQLLSGIPEEKQATIIREMKGIVLKSYRNGQKAHEQGTQQREPASSRAPAAK
jgi:hypothetical protein